VTFDVCALNVLFNLRHKTLNPSQAKLMKQNTLAASGISGERRNLKISEPVIV